MTSDKNHGVAPTPGASVVYEYFIFEEHSVSKGGLLPDFERGAHACWYYCICAHQSLESSDEGAVYEGEADLLGPALNNIARSIAMQYQLEDPSQFMVFMPIVIEEARRVGMGWDPRVLNPQDTSFMYKI